MKAVTGVKEANSRQMRTKDRQRDVAVVDVVHCDAAKVQRGVVVGIDALVHGLGALLIAALQRPNEMCC